MKNLYQTSARTRWDGSGGIFRKCAVLLLAVSLLPVTLSAAGSEPARSTSQTEVPPPPPPPHKGVPSAERSATARATRFPERP